ncbi:MAG: helix-turn-helix transcriptional regulator [Oscillospiraceae bacterium]
MSGEAKKTEQRLKILYLYDILRKYTDEEHSLTMPEIIAKLDELGISAGRKAIYDDIEALKSYGADIISGRGRSSGYYLASRDFELPELKLLADAVSSSSFITEKKSRELLQKIEALASVYEARQISRQVFNADRVKTLNERIYISVDRIHRAIALKKQISFRYFEYDISKRKKYRDGVRVCSPYAMTWDNGRYYLVAFYEKRPDSLTNFRVDRMDDVEITDIAAKPLSPDFSLSDYLGSTFSMFSGETRDVRLRFHNSLVNAAIDRFGKQIRISRDDDEHFSFRVSVKPEAPFFGWLFQFGKNAEIVAPEDIRRKYADCLREVLGTIEE